MDHLDVTPARLRTAASEIRSAARAIDLVLHDLDDSTVRLRAGWSGEAQAAFDAAEKRFRDLMASRADVVRKLCTALEQLAVGYSTVDLEAARALGANA